MRRLCLLLLHYLSAVVDCSLEEGVTEFYDVDGSPVHMIVSGSVLVSDELQDMDLRSNIPIKNTPFKYKKNEVLQSKAIVHDHDIHRRKIKQRINIKTIRNNRSKHIRRKKRLKGSKHKFFSKVRKYAYGKHGKLPHDFYKYGKQAHKIAGMHHRYDASSYEKISNDSSVSGMVRDEIPQKSDKDPLQAERKTIYPPPSNMWKINKELTVTQQTLEEKGVLGERRVKNKNTGVANEVDSIETQLENEQKTTSQENNLKFQSSAQYSKPSSLPTKIIPYQELHHNAHAHALERKEQKEQVESQPNSMHRIEDHLTNHAEGKFHESAEQKYINGKTLDNKQKPIIKNQLKLRHSETLLHAKHALALPHKVTIIKTLNHDKINEESKKINTLLTPSKYTKQIALNSLNAHFAPEGKQETDAKAPERSTMTLESSESITGGAETSNVDGSSAVFASKKTNPSEISTITVESKPQEESTDASISEKYTESLPNTGTKETSFLPQIQEGPQPGVQTEETVQQSSPNIESQSSVDAEYTQTSMETQVPRPSAANSESLKKEAAEGNSQSNEQNAINFCDLCENVEDDQTKAAQVNSYNNKDLQTDSEQPNQHQLAHFAKQVQNIGFEGPIKQTEEVIKEESEVTPINEAVQNLSGVLQSKNTKDEAASQTTDISAKENEQFVSARKNEDDEITITAETPQEAGVQSEQFQNTTLIAKSLTSEKSNEVQKSLNPTDISSNEPIANSATSQSNTPIVEEIQMHQTESTSPLTTNPSSIQVQLPDSPKIVDSELLRKDSALSAETNQYQAALKPVETDQLSHIQNELYKHQQAVAFMKKVNQKAQEQFSREKEEKSTNFFMQNTEPHDSQSESNQVQVQSSYGKNKINDIGFAVNPEDVPFDNKVAFAQAKEQEQFSAEVPNKPPISLGGDYSLLRQNDSASHTELENYASPAYESISPTESEPTNEVLTKDEQLREDSQPSFFRSDAVGKFENSDPSHLTIQADTQGEALSRADLAKSVTSVPKYKNLQAQSPVFEKFSTPQNIERTKTDQFTNTLNSTTLLSAFNYVSQRSNSINDDSYNTNGEYFLPAGVNPGAQMSSQMLDLWKLRGIAPQRGFLRAKIVNKNYLKHAHNTAVEKNNAILNKKVSGSVSKHWSRMRQVPNNVMSVLKPKHPTGPSIAYQQTVPEEVMNSFSKQKSIEKVKSKVDESDEIEENKGLDEKVSSSSPEASPAVLSSAPPAALSPASPASLSPASPPSSLTASAPASPPLSPPVSPAPSSAVSSAPGSSSAAHHEQAKPQTSGYGYGSGSGHGYGERSFGWGGGGGWAGMPPANGIPLPSYNPPPGLPDFPKVGQTPPLPAGSSPKLIHPVKITSSVHAPLPNYLENKKHPPKLKYNPRIKAGYKSLSLTNKFPAKADIFKAGKDQKVRVPVKTKSDVFSNSVIIKKKR